MALLDEFPSTHRTFIARTLANGDVELARNHVMSRAYEPLCIYARVSSLRTIAPAEDLVGGFFASRFGRHGHRHGHHHDYLDQWIAHPRAMPLRRWLVNGLILSARELCAQRVMAHPNPQTADIPRSIEPAPWAEYERRWRNRLLELACDRVAARLGEEGRSEAWTLFVQHVIDGVPYPLLESRTGIRSSAAPMVIRTILRRLRHELTQLLGDELDDHCEIEREFKAILGVYD